MDTLRELRDALMPLIQESIDKSDWNDGEWKTNYWGFTITVGNLLYEYSLGSRPKADDEPLPAYRPVISDPIGKVVSPAALPGNYSVSAEYLNPQGKTLWGHSGIYNPHEDISIEAWAKRFITNAKMHVAGIEQQ